MNANKKSAAKTPPSQQKKDKDKDKEKEGNGGNNTAGTKKGGTSDHVGDPRSDTAKQQQKAGKE